MNAALVVGGSSQRGKSAPAAACRDEREKEQRRLLITSDWMTEVLISDEGMQTESEKPDRREGGRVDGRARLLTLLRARNLHFPQAEVMRKILARHAQMNFTTLQWLPEGTMSPGKTPGS